MPWRKCYFMRTSALKLRTLTRCKGPLQRRNALKCRRIAIMSARLVKCLNANKHVRNENCRDARSSSVDARSPKRDATSAPPSNLSSDGPVRRLAQPIPIEQAQEVDAIDAGGAGRCRDVSAVTAEHRNEVIAFEPLEETRLHVLEAAV